MKRIIACALLICLMLCGCESSKVTKTFSTDPTQEKTDSKPTPETNPSGPAQTETTPTEPQPEKVTVYLIEGSYSYDSGSAIVTYDGNYNIESCELFSVEGDLMCTVLFEEKDANGMPSLRRVNWVDIEETQISTLTFDAEGKLREEQNVGSNFDGWQYEYDGNGNMIQERLYYEGVLDSIAYYEYTGKTLTKAYGENPEGNKLFDCRIENGLIVEKTEYDADGSHSYSCHYEYDTHGNLVKTVYVFDGEQMPGTTYTYKAVEVDAARAAYLQSQQRYLLSVI